MESKKIVYRETCVIAAGEFICVGVMLLVFALLGYFCLPVLLGGVIGGILTILNFFLMAVGASLAADKAVNQDVKSGKKQIKSSYALRMVVIFVILFAFVKSGLCHPVASVLPLAFVHPIITFSGFFRK